MSLSVEKCEWGTLLDLVTYFLLRGPFGDLNQFSQKTSHRSKGAPVVSSGFVGYVKKVNMKGGTICTKFPLAGLSFSSFSSFCGKWISQWEVCGLKKVKVTVIVGRFLLNKKCRLKLLILGADDRKHNRPSVEFFAFPSNGMPQLFLFLERGGLSILIFCAGTCCL